VTARRRFRRGLRAAGPHRAEVLEAMRAGWAAGFGQLAQRPPRRWAARHLRRAWGAGYLAGAGRRAHDLAGADLERGAGC